MKMAVFNLITFHPWMYPSKLQEEKKKYESKRVNPCCYSEDPIEAQRLIERSGEKVASGVATDQSHIQYGQPGGPALRGGEVCQVGVKSYEESGPATKHRVGG